MAINRFHIDHKNWYWFLIFSVNLLIPFTVLMMRLAIDFKDFNYFKPAHLALLLIVVFMVLSTIYAWATLREYRACLMIIKKDAKKYFNGFLIGMICTWLSIFFSFFIVFISFNEDYEKDELCRAAGYMVAVISIVLGLLSNIFLNMFEFRIWFDVFRYKYENTLMKDIVDSINKRHIGANDSEDYRRNRQWR